jgi:hypothetical protein
MMDDTTPAAAAAISEFRSWMVFAVLTGWCSPVTHDRSLAGMICYSAEQCLTASTLTFYVDRCIDSFVIALERTACTHGFSRINVVIDGTIRTRCPRTLQILTPRTTGTHSTMSL